MEPKTKALLEVHIAVLLFGLAGLFGKLISLPSSLITLGRVFFAAILLFIILRVTKESLRLKKKNHYYLFMVLGIILALHWWSFFHSIQISTVAIGLLTFSTFPIFTIFLEPLFFKEKISIKDIGIALITFLGIFLIVPEFRLENEVTLGVIFGVISGLTFAILQILNRKYVQSYSSRVISFYQFLVASLALLPFAFIINVAFTAYDIFLLIILGVVFTAFSHTLFIKGLFHIKVKTASIIASLEPVYGILAAIVILQEIPGIREILGGIIILTMATYVSLGNRK